MPGDRAGVRLLGDHVPGSDVRDAREYDVRIFTPEQEIPFAGHPTIGTAWALRSRGLLDSSECVQVCGAGRIEVTFDGEQVGLAATPRDLAGPLDDALARDVLRVVGLDLKDLAGEAWIAGCGLTFVHLPVTEEAVLRARPTSRRLGDDLLARLEALGDVDGPHGRLQRPCRGG